MLIKRGGARDRLPLPPTFEEFQAAWDFFYVSSHGLFEERLMFVPDNTYVLNLATAGKSCMKLDKHLDDMIYEKTRPPGAAAVNLNPLAAAGAGEAVVAEPISQLERLYISIRDRTFLRDPAAIAARREHIGESGTTARNREELYVNTPAPPPATASLAFYEPGDIMHDTSLHIKNNYLPLLLLGVYRIPVPFDIQKAVFDASKPVLLPTARVNTINRGNVNRNQPLTPATDEQHQIFNREENLIRRQMFPDAGPPVPRLYLSEIIDFTNRTVNDGKNHFFLVKACRSADDPETTKMARRYSIAARAGRERLGVSAETLERNPAARYRSVLNRAFLERLIPPLTRRIPNLENEKNEIKARKKAEQKAGKILTFAEGLKYQSEIADIDREIERVNEGIAILTRILTRGQPFTMSDIRRALMPAKGGLQKELVELLDL